MAKRNPTPESILNAPKLVPVWIHHTVGPNRAQRRHAEVPPTGRRVLIPKQYRQDAINVPYRKGGE